MLFVASGWMTTLSGMVGTGGGGADIPGTGCTKINKIIMRTGKNSHCCNCGLIIIRLCLKEILGSLQPMKSRVPGT